MDIIVVDKWEALSASLLCYYIFYDKIPTKRKGS